MAKKYNLSTNRYRLALDVGSSSIGWAIFALGKDNGGYEPSNVIKTGVRIFSDGRGAKTHESLAVERREKRQMRRMRDRFVQRRQKLLNALKKYDMMAEEREEIEKLIAKNPLELRSKALDEKLSLHELGRAIFHLSKKRGFKSNRKTDKGKNKDTKIDSGIKKTQELMWEYKARTYGELMCVRNRERELTKVRFDDGNKKDPYEFYPLRKLIEDEFNTIWNVQKKYYPDELSDEAYNTVFNAIFFQRPLKPQKIGKCTFLSDEFRAAKALPISQEFLLFQELNNLKVRDEGSNVFRELVPLKRKVIYDMMNNQKTVTFDGIRKKMKTTYHFNLEHEGKKELCTNEINSVMSGKDYFGDSWKNLNQNDIINKLISDNSDEDVLNYLKEFNLPEENIKNIMNANLPDGYLRISTKFLELILPYMRSGLRYDEACKEAGYDHNLPQPKDVLAKLPYYGELLGRYLLPGTGEEGDHIEKRLGKIANPTVHIALNELRKIVNAIVEKYGNPQQIVVEMARDIPLGAEGRGDIIKLQVKNKAENDRIAGKIKELGRVPSHDSMLRYKLWEEQDHRCIYTGRTISAEMALSHECQIDHILPYSKTHDDSKANKVLCVMGANQQKGNRSPFEAWGDSEGYSEILMRAEELPMNKKLRFESDAMDKFEEEDEFLANQLNDTRYMSRVAREYLYYICKQNKNGNKDVWTVNGRLTEMLRRVIGLNNILGDTGEKNRNDHRHHAVDAVVVGIISRSMIQKIHTVAERYSSNNRKEEKLNKMLGEIFPPFPRGENIETVKNEFRARVENAINKIIVSHKPDHGKEGALHEETAYGMLPDGNLFVHKREDGKRVLKKVIESKPIPIYKKGEDKPYKWFASGSNCYVDILDTEKGYVIEGASTFEVNQRNYTDKWIIKHPNAKHLMRLYINDILEDCDGNFYKVVILNPLNGNVWLANIKEAGSLQKRHTDESDSFRWLFASMKTFREKRLKHVVVDVLGNVYPAKRIKE